MTQPSSTFSSKQYDAIADEYDSGYESPRWDLSDHVTSSTIAPLLPPAGGLILDAGAGTGRFSVRFARTGHHVVLLEPSRKMLRVARGKVSAAAPAPSAAYVQGTIDNLAFPGEAFDFVFSDGDPLSYCIKTHVAAANEIMRVLKPGGTFYVSCDNRWYGALVMLGFQRPDLAEACASQGRSFDPYGLPVHAFDPQELQELFERAGADDVKVGGKMVMAHFLPDKLVKKIMEDDERKAWLYDMETQLAMNPRFAGMASHLHVTGRKPVHQ